MNIFEEQRVRVQEGKQEKYAMPPLDKGGKRRGDYSNKIAASHTLLAMTKKNPTTANAVPLPLTREVKQAFTLAEVLITLGIIGIVAAMTMPAVIANHQSSILQQRFKKAYSSMSQVLQRVAFEDGISSVSNLIKACNERIIKSSVCLYGQNNCDTTIFPFANYESASNLSSLFNYHYGITWHFSNLMNDGILALNDGTFVFFDYGDGSGKTLITIDTNGWQKKPNKAGVDLFMFELKSNGALVPVEEVTPTNGNSPLSRNTNCLANPDVTCTYEALSNPDYFKKVKKN